MKSYTANGYIENLRDYVKEHKKYFIEASIFILTCVFLGGFAYIFSLI